MIVNNWIDPGALAEPILRTFDLSSSALPLYTIGTGFKSVVLESPSGLVFRVALNEKAQKGHRRECSILPRLKLFLPFEVPELLGYSEGSDDFPFGVMMQKKVEGLHLGSILQRSSRVQPIATRVAELVLAIQSITREDMSGLSSNTAPLHDETWSYAQPFLRTALRVCELSKVEDWWARYCQDLQQGCMDYRFIHGDLWYEHILFNPVGEPRVAGVLDFEHAGFGDPITDFVPQMHLGRDFVIDLLEAYQSRGGEIGPDAISRIGLHVPYRELGGLCYCLENDDRREAEVCVEKLIAALAPF